MNPAGAASKAVFLDRDGTLNVAVVRDGHPFSPQSAEEFSLYDDVRAGCTALRAAGFVLVVATNQPDVGRGLQTRAAVEEIHGKLVSLIPEIARIEVCYDPGRGEDSRRRKPGPGMLLDAAGALGLDLGRSWMIGDRWRDVDCGAAAGTRTVFIDRGYSEKLHAAPDFVVGSFGGAVAAILGAERSKRSSSASPPGDPIS
jgi:D-glycero-D-manno-heptose 1,7-bisphosphate phosphatase